MTGLAAMHFKAEHRAGSHAKMPSKIPYVITTLDWNTTQSGYTDSSKKIVMTWNADSTPKQMTIYDYDPARKAVIDSFVNRSGGAEINDFEFLGDWLPVQGLDYTKPAGQWVLRERMTVKYTSQGITEVLTETWTNNAWENFFQELYLYDTYDLPLGYVNQEWDGTQWVNQSGERITYTYDAGSGVPIQAEFFSWSIAQDDWIQSDGRFKEVYTLDMFEEISSALIYTTDGAQTLIDSIGGLTWEDFDIMESGPISTGGSRYKSYTLHSWDRTTDTWEPVSSYAKTYNIAGDETEELIQDWDATGSAWVDAEKTTTEYYPDGEVREILQSEWTGSAWDLLLGQRWGNSYDDDNDIIVQTYDVNFGGGWENESKTIYRFTDPTGLGEAPVKQQVSFYPNPASAKLIVELENGMAKTGMLRIISLSGQVVYSEPVQASAKTLELDIASLDAGIYFLSVEAGNAVRTSRFVKQ